MHSSRCHTFQNSISVLVGMTFDLQPGVMHLLERGICVSWDTLSRSVGLTIQTILTTSPKLKYTMAGVHYDMSKINQFDRAHAEAVVVKRLCTPHIFYFKYLKARYISFGNIRPK